MKNFKYIWISLFFGSLWGLAEVTLGYAMHALLLPITGLVMFPVGYYFLRQTHRHTGKISAVFLAGLVTASIKLTNFYFPFILPIRIIHPALAIILETLAVAVAFAYMEKRQVGFPAILGMCLSWRVAFFAVQVFELGTGFIKDLSYYTLSYSFQFFAVESLINAAIIYFVFHRQKQAAFGDFKSDWSGHGFKIASVGLYAAAVFIQFSLI